MKYELVTNKNQLDQLLLQLASARAIALDTEFVSEYTYYPNLCLVQIATERQLAVVDAHAVDVTDLWRLLATGSHETVVHAGREEYRFLQRAAGQGPHNWFDIQLAAGMIGLEYPASYSKILQRLLGEKLPKGETRTDWRRRPLSESQIEYALLDVVHLLELRERLHDRLEELERVGWYDGEMAFWLRQIEESETRQRWRRVNGLSRLSRRSQLIVKELWTWRDDEARRRDCLPRRVLRDDLLIELARRGRAGAAQARAIRGMQRRDLQEHLSTISCCIKRALEMPLASHDDTPRVDLPPQINVLAQFLGTALTSMCNKASIAPNLVGTVQDTRDLVAHALKLRNADEPPALATGWRGDLFGRPLTDLLKGKLAIRISNPMSEQPLSFE